MRESDIVRTVTIKQVSEGAAKVQSDLKGTATAQDNLAASSSNLATVSETSARKVASVATQFENLEKRVNPAVRALAELQRVQKTVGMAVSNDASLQGRANNVVDFFTAKSEAAAAAQDELAVAAARLRAQLNPLETEQGKLAAELMVYKKALDSGRISTQEFAAAQTLAGKRLSDFEKNMRNGANAGRVMSGELANLSFQLNDVVTGLALGQSPFMILAQQGGQVVQIFQNSKASVVDFFKEIGSKAAALLTVGRLVFGGIATAVLGAVTALISFQGKQIEVQRQLSGAGRASGATAGGIDAIAQGNANGFSVSEARNLAAALAATGKVGVEAIGPIVKLGHDFAKTYGVDAKEATEILAKAFADPVQGAEELNQRLGFLDAVTKDLIQSLVTQGKRLEAVKVLTDAVQGSIAKASEVTSIWGRAWETTGNAIKNIFDDIGRGADRLFDGGSGLQEQIEGLTIKLLELQKAKIEGGFLASLDNFFFNTEAQIKSLTAQLDALAKRRTNQQPQANNETALKARALEIDAIAKAALPAADAERRLTDQAIALNEAVNNPALQRYMTTIGVDLVKAADRAAASAARLKNSDPVANQIADMEAQVRLLDQRTIKDRAREAADAERRRQVNSTIGETEAESNRKIALAALLAAGGYTALDNAQKQRLATLGRTASVTEEVQKVTLDLTEADRAGAGVSAEKKKILTDLARDQARGIDQIKQQIDATNIQAQTIGMSAGAAAAYTAKQTILNDALRNHKELTSEDIAAIEEQAAALGKATEASEKLKVAADIKFKRDTVFLTSEDVQIAQQLAGLYGNDVPKALASSEASAIRLTNSMKDIRDTAADFTKDLVRGLMSGKTGMEALASAATSLSTKLADKALTSLFSGDFLGAAVSGIGALVSGIVGKESQKAADLEKAKKAWEGMADQVTEFNAAAAGFDLGPLTTQVKSLMATLRDLQKAAAEAEDTAAVFQLGDTFNRGLIRITKEFVNGAETLLPLEQSIKDVNNEAQGLIESFDKFPELAAQVTEALPRRIAALAAAFKATNEAMLQADINSANGVGYINEVTDALKKFDDLAGQGIDRSKLNEWLHISVQKIVNDAGLTGAALTEFFAKFPQFTGTIIASTSALAEAQEKAIDDAQQLVDTRRAELTEAYNRESSAIQSTIDKTKSYIASLKDLQDSLKLNKDLSTLNPQQQYLEAQRQARAIAALAASGDEDAQGKLSGALTAYLDQSKSFNAATEAYYKDFMEVQQILTDAQATGQQQVDVATRQLNALNAQVAGLITINSSVLTVAAAIGNLQGAMAGLLSATYATPASSSAASAASAASVAASFAAYGGSYSAWSAGEFAKIAALGVPSYASGTDFHPGGLAIVGERGPELLNLPRGSQVTPNGGASNDNLTQEIRALREEVRGLRNDTRAGAGHVREGVDNIATATKQKTNSQRQAENRPQRTGTAG